MTDVWQYQSVTGKDRQGHATPKPVEIMQRIMNSSLTKDGLCIEPFGGSGSTLIGAEKTNKISPERRRRMAKYELETFV